MTKSEFVDQVASSRGLSKKEAESAVEAVLGTVENVLSRGGEVTFTGKTIDDGETLRGQIVDLLDQPYTESRVADIPPPTIATSSMRTALSLDSRGVPGSRFGGSELGALVLVLAEPRTRNVNENPRTRTRTPNPQPRTGNPVQNENPEPRTGNPSSAAYSRVRTTSASIAMNSGWALTAGARCSVTPWVSAMERASTSRS